MPVVFLPETSDVECVADNRYRVSFCDTQLDIYSKKHEHLLLMKPPSLPSCDWQLGKNTIRIWN